MKKSIKAILVGASLVVSMVTLTACGNTKNEESRKVENVPSNSLNRAEEETNKINGIENIVSNKEETIVSKEVDKTPVDYKKDNVYFFVADGKKFNMGDKISSLEDIKLHLNKTGAGKELAVNGYLIGGDSILNENGKTVFSCTPVNTTKEKIKAADASIGSVRISDSYFKDYNKIEITNGITIGTSIEDIEAVFGTPTKTTENYNGKTYEYDGGLYREFSFTFDEEGKVKSIYCQNYMPGVNQ